MSSVSKKDFGGLRALSGIDIEIQVNEIVGLIGPNGSGKTTCLNVISGLIKLDGGKVEFQGKTSAGSCRIKSPLWE